MFWRKLQRLLIVLICFFNNSEAVYRERNHAVGVSGQQEATHLFYLDCKPSYLDEERCCPCVALPVNIRAAGCLCPKFTPRHKLKLAQLASHTNV